MDSLIDRAREQILGPRRELAELKAKGSFNTQMRRRLWNAYSISTPVKISRLNNVQRAALTDEIYSHSWMGEDWWCEILGIHYSTYRRFLGKK